MTMDVETFTARFTQALLRNSPANTNYELTTTLVNALNEAMRTPDSVGYRYPRMLFRNAAAHCERFSRTGSRRSRGLQHESATTRSCFPEMVHGAAGCVGRYEGL
jgi:hypothetical protein